MNQIQEAILDHQIERCFSVLAELRPELVRAQFLEQIKDQRSQGYRLVYIEQEGEAKAAMGYRFSRFLAWGRVLYVDDLITLPSARGQGLGKKLLDYARDQARINSCEQIHLDSGYHRQDAHRLYLNHGFRLSSHHFEYKISVTE